MSAQRFVIISYPRTGSTFLTLKLHSSSSVICYSEVFHKKRDAFDRSFYTADFKLHQKRWYGKKTLDLQNLFDLRNKDHRKFLETLYESTAETLGFKIFPGQHDAAMEELVRDEQVKKIFLIREDMLRNFVSYQLAMESGKWDRMPGEKAELRQVRIDPQEFLNYAEGMMRSIEELQSLCHDSGQDYLDLSYEEITTRLPIQKLSEFLRVPLDDIQEEVAREKQNPFALKEMVENYKELESALEGTRWSRFLEESDIRG